MVAVDAHRAPPAVAGETAIEIGGHLPQPMRYTADALRTLPRHELGPTAVNCFTGRPVARVDSYAGVRVVDLLDRSGFATLPRSELKRCVVVAGSLDGYQAIFSWNELYNSPLGPRVLVLYEREGTALGPHLGELCLISAGDAQLGPRHLRHLVRITARQL